MLVMGLVGYILKRCDVPREGMLLGLVLGSMAESELARALSLVHGEVGALLIQIVTRPISLILFTLCLFYVGHAIRTQYRAKQAAKSTDTTVTVHKIPVREVQILNSATYTLLGQSGKLDR